MAIYTKYQQLKLIESDWRNLKNIDNQYADVCIEAIKKDIRAINYLKKITKRIIHTALQKDNIFLKYINNQDYTFLKNINNKTLKYISNQTEELCLEAVKKYGRALEYVNEQTEKICIEAVKQDAYALEYVKEQTEEICLEAVKQDGFALQFVKEQTEEICLEAVKQDGLALIYVKEQTEVICLEAIKRNEKVFEHVKDKTPKICFYVFVKSCDMFNTLYDNDIEYRVYEHMKSNCIKNKVFCDNDIFNDLKINADFYFDYKSLEYIKDYLFKENINNTYIMLDIPNVEILKEIALSNNELIIVDTGNIKSIHKKLANRIIKEEDLEKESF